jgi:hypothetical protein
MTTKADREKHWGCRREVFAGLPPAVPGIAAFLQQLDNGEAADEICIMFW